MLDALYPMLQKWNKAIHNSVFALKRVSFSGCGPWKEYQFSFSYSLRTVSFQEPLRHMHPYPKFSGVPLPGPRRMLDNVVESRDLLAAINCYFLETTRSFISVHPKRALILTSGGIFVSEATTKRYFFNIRANTSFISIWANRIPMQLCGLWPNGR